VTTAPLYAFAAALLLATACTPTPDWNAVRATAETARDDVADTSAAVSALAPGLVALCPAVVPEPMRETCKALDVAWQVARQGIVEANRAIALFDATGQGLDAMLRVVDACDDAGAALRKALDAARALAEPVPP